MICGNGLLVRTSPNSLCILTTSIGAGGCFGVFGGRRTVPQLTYPIAGYSFRKTGNPLIQGTAHRASKGPPERGLTGITALPNEVHDVEQVATSRSLDLTPCGFFMWGYLEDKVFSTSPQNMEDLRQKIIEQFNALREQPDVTRKAVRDVHKRTV
jgi:hypothetical protein